MFRPIVRHDHHQRVEANQRDGGEISDGVAKRSIQITIDRVGERGDINDVAVGVRMRDEFGCDVPACSGLVFAYGLLAPNLRQLSRDYSITSLARARNE